VIPTLKNHINTETPRNNPRSGVLPTQTFVAMKNQSGAYSGTLPEGESSSEAIFIIPEVSMTRRE
jgi:hypothetical protein